MSQATKQCEPPHHIHLDNKVCWQENPFSMISIEIPFWHVINASSLNLNLNLNFNVTQFNEPLAMKKMPIELMRFSMRKIPLKISIQKETEYQNAMEIFEEFLLRQCFGGIQL